jgi:hypothetical protein
MRGVFDYLRLRWRTAPTIIMIATTIAATQAAPATRGVLTCLTAIPKKAQMIANM